MKGKEEKKKQKSLLSRLRMAVKKVKLLLSATIMSQTWQATSLLRGVSLSKQGQIGFNDRPGLMMCSTASEQTDSEGFVSPPRSLQRTISYPSDDDVDKRAEIFINNFRRQLQMERQFSLQLRYCTQNTLQRLSP
ncbi:hypothetical protein VNO78_23314 [Psophocarpus tetragonolobus]|uniref:DUF761 domain-containing protein n=1 Tax=Psophocarpus tetragonolobus TaxID=3891 RepID=A0AAN9XDD0_PSOTE